MVSRRRRRDKAGKKYKVGKVAGPGGGGRPAGLKGTKVCGVQEAAEAGAAKDEAATDAVAADGEAAGVVAAEAVQDRGCSS